MLGVYLLPSVPTESALPVGQNVGVFAPVNERCSFGAHFAPHLSMLSANHHVTVRRSATHATFDDPRIVPPPQPVDPGVKPEPGNGRVLVVIVNYRSASWTVRALRSLAGVEAIRILVVDNDSKDGSFQTIKQAVDDDGMDNVSLLAANENGGFSSGNNLAVRNAFSGGLTPDYVFLLNPDTEAAPGAIAELVRFMDQHPRVGICGSRILNEDGSVRPSAWRFPSVVREFERTAKIGLFAKAFPRATMREAIPDQAQRVDWVSGAAMMVRREVLEEVGLLDDDYFLYFEETDWCLRARMSGWSTWYVPTSEVTHFVGKSTQATGEGAHKRPVPDYWFDSRRLFFIKNHGQLYARVADLAWLSGTFLGRARRIVEGKPRNEPPRLLRDFVRAAFRPMPQSAFSSDPRRRDPIDDAAANRVALPSRGTENQNPKDIGLGELLWEDFRTYDRSMLEPGFWAVAVHRFGNARMDVPWRPVRAPLTLAYKSLSLAVHWGWGIKLDYTVKLGRRVRIWHHGGMVFGAREIGDDVQLRQNTTLGVRHRGRTIGKPIIEDGVDIGAGACIVGGVRVGHHSMIGANTLVTADVPPESLVVCPRATIVKRLNVQSAQHEAVRTE